MHLTMIKNSVLKSFEKNLEKADNEVTAVLWMTRYVSSLSLPLNRYGETREFFINKATLLSTAKCNKIYYYKTTIFHILPVIYSPAAAFSSLC